jgi:S-adenosylmethionine synthetase
MSEHSSKEGEHSVAGMTFSRASQFFFTSESVTEGHPDKVADQISDAIVDAHMAEDPQAKVACETVTKGGMVMIFGETKSTAHIDYDALTRQVIRDIGYTDPRYGFDDNTSSVVVSLVPQSPDYLGKIDHAVDFETDDVPDHGPEPIGAGDQGIMSGFATDETPELMPLPISLAHSLTRRMARMRKEGILPYLRPDGKSQVTVEYRYGRPVRVDTILMLAHHDEGVEWKQIDEDLRSTVINEAIPGDLLDERTKIYTNPTGRFVAGGPLVDTGLTGRKLQVDTYGGAARHGGGAFSGKDATKVDRSGAYAARYIAKNVVAAGLATSFEVQISYAVAMSRPLSVSFETFGTNKVPEEKIAKAIRETFDLRPGAIIRDLGLRTVAYRPVAAYGHFGRPDLDLPWERTSRVTALQSAADL